MGLEDRDWYREEPSKAWKQRWDPTPGSSGSRVRVRGGAWLAILVSGALMAVTWHWHLLAPIHLGTASRAHAAAPAAKNIVRLRPGAQLDVPVQSASQWWITDPRFGRLGVYVSIGETPRQAFTAALAKRGYHVVP